VSCANFVLQWGAARRWGLPREGKAMDTVRRRRCETCDSHEPGPTPCTGICRNPEWQPRSDAIRFVRDRELACYRGWGIDYWRPKSGSAPSAGTGGAIPGSGGQGGDNSGRPYATLVGSPVVPLIPIELLADRERREGRELFPGQYPEVVD
jgi:hypothetical protein